MRNELMDGFDLRTIVVILLLIAGNQLFVVFLAGKQKGEN